MRPRGSAKTPNGTPQVVVFGEADARPLLAPRTLRALGSLGIVAIDLSRSPLFEIGERLSSGPVWLLRAGAWPAQVAWSSEQVFPPDTSNGAVLCALGAVTVAPHEAASSDSAAWSRLLQRSGGDLNRAFRGSRALELPPLASVYLNGPAAESVRAACAQGATLSDAVKRLWKRGLRLVRYAPLDVHDDARPRVAQVVTSLQRGGAERIALDLTTELPSKGIASRLYSVYSAGRGSFAAPAGSVDLARAVPGDASREERWDRLQRELIAWGADLVHAHLLDAADLARLSARSFRALVTVHNTRAGFPLGLGALSSEHATLLVGCASAVEAELRATQLPIPLRTVWNGIRRAQPSAGGGFRARLGIAPDALVVLALANPRPQKRLHALPGIIAALRARDPQQRAVHLIVAGEASAQSEAAQRARAELQAELERHRLAEHAHLVGLVTDTAALLAESDVLVSPSEHEGLSLAHLEALAAGVPVVATGDGGTRELAAECPRLRHLPVTSSADTFAREILELAATRDSDSAALVDRHYSASRMAAQYARLYEPALARNSPRRQRSGILLVTNNFSLGGAQSSARRLLLGLKAAGVSVRAVTIEEQPEYPTLGRAALCDAGVEVLALPPPHVWEPERTVRRLLEAIEEQPPEAVVLWNVIAVHKLLLADGLLDTPLFDVSPGEMYFASLQRYFATSRQPGLPYRDARAYGARLSGVVVKHAAEAARAGQLLGCPVHVIPNGVDASATPRARHSQAPLGIGTAVRIHPDKRVDELLSAVRLAAPALPPFVLRIAGGADRGANAYAAELRRKSADLPVEWLGELSDSREFLDTLDVFALVAEPAGCPNASLEAMARGLPVVATDVGGMREQIEPNVTGKLVARADVNAFAAALIELGKDAPLRQRLGNAALERVRQLFSLDRMVAAYRELCIDQRPSAPAMLSTRASKASSDWCTSDNTIPPQPWPEHAAPRFGAEPER